MTKAYAAPVGNSYEDVQELRRLMLQTMGRRFRAVFVSRGRAEVRDMRARLKRIDPETVAEDRRNHQFHVWDIEKKEWRIVPLERVALLSCGDIEWVTKVGS